MRRLRDARAVGVSSARVFPEFVLVFPQRSTPTSVARADVQSEVKSAAPRPLNGRVARLPIVRLELKDALLKSRRVLGCIRSRHFNDHARRLQGPRLHDDAPVRRTAQEEPAAVGADAQLSETQSHPVRGSPSQSTSLHHRSQEFVVASLEKLPKTGRKPVFPLNFASKRQFLGKDEKKLPSHAFRGTGRSDGAPNMARGGASQPQPGWTPNSACI